MTTDEVRALFASRKLPCTSVREVRGSFDKALFLVDGAYLLRTSASPMDRELAKNLRVAGIPDVPRVIDSGEAEFSGAGAHFILLSLLEGEDLFGSLENLSGTEGAGIARSLARFLQVLHEERGDAYDIGHYIPILGGYRGSWREGHEAYQQGILKALREGKSPPGLDVLGGDPSGPDFFRKTEVSSLIDACEEYFLNHASSLDHQAGPRLLHNDFHPKNVIVQNRRFSGVIDWECSQYGEPDFDLVHFVHWTLAPFEDSGPLSPVSGPLVGAYLNALGTPRPGERLTVYLLEHDLLQLLWGGGKRGNFFVERMRRWLSGEAEDFVARALALGESLG